MKAPARIAAMLLALLLALPLAAAGKEEPAAAPMALHLLDYIAVDYAGAVEGGRVKSEDEYKEMSEFAGEVAALVKALPAIEGQRALEAEAAKLAEQVALKAEPAEVTATAKGLRDAIVRAHGISLTPRRPPDLALGASLFAQHCATCHGADGRGDGPAARSLTPAPSDFHDIERMSQRSLYSFYNTITLGVKGTAMASFATLGEDERWALAAQVMSFSKPAPPAGSQPAPLDFAARQLSASLDAYRAGDRRRATEAAIQAYLEGFELAEKALSHVDAPLMTRTERAMMEYRRLVQSGAPVAEVAAQARAIDDLLAEARAKLAGEAMSAAATFTAAFLILLREGLEAVLVLAAIFAFLDKTGRRDAKRFVHFGWIAALVLGALTWYVSSKVISISGASREITEGVTALVCAAMLLYVGFWLHDKAHSAAWQQFIHARVGGALSGGTVGTLAVISFLAVYREMFETVLFYQALAAQAGPEGHGALVGGVAVGFAVLLVLTWAILRWSARVPLRLFFTLSALLLAALAVVFTGQGIGALQEAGWVDSDAAGTLRIPMLGIFPTLQALGAQAAVSILIVAGLLWARRKSVS